MKVYFWFPSVLSQVCSSLSRYEGSFLKTEEKIRACICSTPQDPSFTLKMKGLNTWKMATWPSNGDHCQWLLTQAHISICPCGMFYFFCFPLPKFCSDFLLGKAASNSTRRWAAFYFFKLLSICFREMGRGRKRNTDLFFHLFVEFSPENMFLLILEREEGKAREPMWQKNNIQLPPIHTLTRDQTHNLGMCPDWELNPQPSGLQDGAPTNWDTSQGCCPTYLWMHWLLPVCALTRDQTLNLGVSKQHSNRLTQPGK